MIVAGQGLKEQLKRFQSSRRELNLCNASPDAQTIELEQPLVSWVSWRGSSRQSVSQVLQIS